MNKPTPEPAARGRPRDAQLADRVLAATVSMLFEQGFAHITVDAVAKRAGVAKQTVYRRWPSRDKLILDAITVRVDVDIPLPDTGSLVDDLSQVYTATTDFLRTPEGVNFAQTLAEESVRDERIGALVFSVLRRRAEVAQKVFDRAVARGEARPDVPVQLVIETVAGLLLARVVLHAPMPTQNEVEELIRLTMDGVRGR